MKVKCVLCDTVHDIEDNSLKAKRLRNRRITMYLCEECDGRIYDRTQNAQNWQLPSIRRTQKKKDLI